MTLLSHFFSLVPLLLGLTMWAFLISFLKAPSWYTGVLLVFAVYGLPPLLFRLVTSIWRIREGSSRLDDPRRFSPWWAGHQIQVPYLAVPALEAILRPLPGVYSFWLRLWGSRVGRGVYWTPQVEIMDRNLLDVGNHVVFGHRVACYGHLIRMKRGHATLYVKTVTIGDRAFLGAGSRLGPGAEIAPGAVVPMLSDLYPNETHEAEDDTKNA